MKTLIELFDNCQIENAIAGLRFKPEKIVFVGFKQTMSSTRKQALIDFLTSHNPDVVLEFEIVGRYDFSSIVERFNAIIDRNPDCGFDLTGGKELVLAAMGAVSAERNVPMFQIDVTDGHIIKIKNCDDMFEPEKNVMTIDEAVALNGAYIVREEENDFCWEFTSSFKRDVESMWDICRQNFGLWNRQCIVLSAFAALGKLYEDLSLFVDLEALRKRKIDTMVDETIMQGLQDIGCIYDYKLGEDVLSFRFKDRQIQECLTKAGTLLELYSFMILSEINEENPGYYDDMNVSVFIDWDGVIHSEFDKDVDTRNEIDIMLTRDMVPFFISCKNGETPKDALYELDTLSKRFGGKYAKGFLVASVLSYNDKKQEFLRQRAEDMEIGLIVLSDYPNATKEDIKQVFYDIIK